MKLTYVIKYVADMDKAVEFFRDRLGMELRLQSSHWTEFSTGDTTLALHIASDAHPAGSSSLGFCVADVDAFYRTAQTDGITFTQEPTETFGVRIAKFSDSEGAECSLSGNRN